MKLQNLKPRLGLFETQRVKPLEAPRPGATPRLEGRQAVKRRALFLREHPLCQACQAKGRATEATEVDHIIPLAEGGEEEWENLQGLCGHHHREKTAAEAARRGGSHL